MSDRFWTEPDYVASLVAMGSRWGNENRGGFLFHLSSVMPGDIDYFIVRPMDVSLELFLTLLLTAEGNHLKVMIHYEKGSATENPGKYEGDVVAIKLVTEETASSG